jgi:hypothetical protein
MINSWIKGRKVESIQLFLVFSPMNVAILAIIRSAGKGTFKAPQ